jgi:hypothetical protein
VDARAGHEVRAFQTRHRAIRDTVLRAGIGVGQDKRIASQRRDVPP